MNDKEATIENNRKVISKAFFGDNGIREYIPRRVFLWATGIMSEGVTINTDDDLNFQLFCKLMHTENVIFAGQNVMETEKTVDWNYKTGVTLCFLHDIDCFVNVQKSNIKGIGSETSLHGELGANMIGEQRFKIPNIDIIVDAIYWHYKKINGSKSDYGKLIRDADKIAIFCHFKCMEDSDSSQLERCRFSGNEIRQEYLDEFLNSPNILGSTYNTTAEWLLRMCAWFRDLNFESTKQKCRKEKYPEMMIRYLERAEVDKNQLELIEKRIVKF